jgi:hypothetical protein
MPPQAHAAVVVVRPRVYRTTTWSRRDTIYLGERKIGIIRLDSSNRLGKTSSLITHNSVTGRQIQWCVEQSAAAA